MVVRKRMTYRIDAHSLELREKSPRIAYSGDSVHALPRKVRCMRRVERIADADESFADESHRVGARTPRRPADGGCRQRHNGIDAVQPGYRLAQGAGGQLPSVTERALGIHHDNFDAARQAIVLQPVVGKDHVAIRMQGQQRVARCHSVARNCDCKSGARQQQGLIADAMRIVVGRDQQRHAVIRVAAITATHNPRVMAAKRKGRSKRCDQRRLPAPAHGDITDHDHWNGESYRPQQAVTV